MGGFTYLGVLLLIAFMGAALGAVGEVWRTVQLREAERDLRFIGNEFRHAIGRYYESTPGQPKKFPRQLDDLLEDDRYPSIRRYLRRVYRDPITGRREWGLVAAPDGGIAGVHSLSTDEPFGFFTAGTAPSEAGSTGKMTQDGEPQKEDKKARYSDWTFVYTPPAPPSRPAVPPPGAARPSPGVPR